MRFRTAASLVWIALSAGACSDSDGAGPTGGPGADQQIEVGDTLLVTIARPDSIVRVSFHADADQQAALFAQGVGGEAWLVPFDSATGTRLDGQLLLTTSPALPLTALRTARLQVARGQTVVFEVSRRSGQSSATVRLWLYRVNPDPELVPALVSPGDTIVGETLENSADVDEFLVSGAAQEAHIGFLLAGPGIPVYMQATTMAGSRLGYPAASDSTDVELEAQQTGRFTVSGTSGYRVRVDADGLGTYDPRPGPGAYTFQLRRIDLGPEAAPATLQPGDTLGGERIDFVGDIDRFQVSVTAGARFNVFLQALAAPDAGAILALEASMAGDTSRAFSTEGDSALRRQFTGIIQAPVTGTLEVLVRGSSDFGRLDRGPYRVFVYPIDTMPELTLATLTPGDSVVGETIEFPGDMDYFMVTGAYDTLNVLLRRDASAPEPLDLVWHTNGNDLATACYPPLGAPERSCLTGGFVGGASGTPLVVESQKFAATSFSGPYTLVTIPLSNAPEGVAAQLTPGMDVSSEIDVPGDVDRFTLNYQRGTPLDLDLDGRNISSQDGFSALVTDSVGNWFHIMSWLGLRVGRFDLPASGTYWVVVQGMSGGVEPAEVGPYTLHLTPVSRLPETAPQSIVAGAAISTESIDELGDIDEFMLVAMPGTEVQAVQSLPLARVEAWIPGDTIPLKEGANGASGRVVVPGGGALTFRVAEPRVYVGSVNEAFRVTGAYTLRVDVINRAPELATSVVSLGVEVSGEQIDYVGDIDEFSFAGAQGQVINLWLDNLSSFDTLRMRLDLIDPSTGQVVGSVATASQTPIVSAGFTLPTTRSYLLRAQSLDETTGLGVYRFRVQ